MKNNVSVLVSGASVSGLSVAYWLVHHGFNVTVVERAPHIRPGGQALDVRGPALEVAERMGISAEIRSRSTKLNGMSVFDSAGNETLRSTERSLTGGRLDSPDVEILRDDLCAVLHQAVGNEAEYLFDDSVSLLSQDEYGVDVTFASADPRRFDLVIGADGLHSGVRELAFGPEQRFIRHLGGYLAVFATPNFLGLDHWEVFHQDGSVFGGVVGLRENTEARTYIYFGSEEPVDYDHRDIFAQKQLVGDRVAAVAWEFPRIVEHMWQAPDFHFDSMSQIHMDSWSRGRVVLVGDAGYSVSPRTGQGTTIAMVGAYVLAGELASHNKDLVAGIGSYERELRDYIAHNQKLALDLGPQIILTETAEAEADTHPDGVPDFGQMVQALTLKDY